MTEINEEKLPVHEKVNILDFITLYKTDKWWAVVAECESFGHRDISLYQWQNKNGSWKRQNKWRFKNQAEWLAVKKAVEQLISKL
ncbi:MAG: hypothetical protein ACTSQY_05395 [Candidatus Odinarchaeia archaeon]